MFCNVCGREMRPEQTSCSSCGNPVIPVAPKSPAAPRRGKIKAFWDRVSEGQALSQLWSELRADTRTSYRLYARDVDRGTLAGVSKLRRFLRYVRQLFWAVVTKLTPARRVVLLLGLVLLFWPSTGSTTYGGLLILLVLVLELADRVTMKRDLEIPRDTALACSECPSTDPHAGYRICHAPGEYRCWGLL